MQTKRYVPPTNDEVACFAYAIYAQEDPVRARELWSQAKAQLTAIRQHEAGLLTIPEATTPASMWS